MQHNAIRISIILSLILCLDSSAQWFNDYKPLDDIYDRLDQFAANHPNLVEPFTIGQSWEGRDIRGIKISGTGGTKAVRPGVLLNGTQHAREWISPMTNMYAAEQLLSQYGTNPAIQEMLDQVDFYVIPVVNPDGYAYTWIDPLNDNFRLWRKNRRPNGFSGTVGVDLNRNWDYGWGLDSGSSSDPGSETYRGTAPFSEPETAAMRDFYLAHQNLVSNIDFHAYSQLVLYPFGYSSTDEPEDRALLANLAVDMATAIHGVNGKIYDPLSASGLYLASGVSIDWSYGDQNVYSYTIELRPDFFFPGFELPPSEILPTAEEAFAAVLELGDFTVALGAGDFDNNGQFNCADVDALYDAILNGSNKFEFDVSGDGTANAQDLVSWLNNASQHDGRTYLPGDANLDGHVDELDFNQWNQNRFTQSDSFCRGDFNVDGVTDLADLHIWNEFKFQSSSLIPEPSGAVAIVWGWFLTLLLRCQDALKSRCSQGFTAKLAPANPNFRPNFQL